MDLSVLFYPIQEYIRFAWDQISGMTFSRFVQMFWFFFFLDVPRYLVPDIIMLFKTVLSAPLAPFYGLKQQTPPLVSVIVPARNEADTIGYTLKSLLESNYPADRLEIIVVDDGSEDNTYRIASAYADRGNVRVFRKEIRGGKASCLAYGLWAAKGEFIVSVDSDSTFDRNAIRNVLKPFNDPKVGAVSGNIKVRNRDANLLTQLQHCEYMVGISMGRRWLAWINMLTIVSGAFGCYRRSVLEQSGAWDPGIGDDSNVTLKTRKLGFKVGFAPDAICMTNAPTRLSILFKQRRRWNRSFIRNRFRKHREIMNPFVFSVRNLLAILQGFFFRVFLLVSFFVYLIYMLLFYPEYYPILFGLGWLLYAMSSCLSLAISTLLSERREEEWTLLRYALLLPFYRLYLRFPRLTAYIQEVFRIHYAEPFYPGKVWAQAPRW